MEKIIKYWICNIDDGLECAFYTYDRDTYEQYTKDNHYITWID